MLARDLHRGTGPDVIRAHEEVRLGTLFLGSPVQAPQDLLGRFLAGVDHVLALLQAFVEGRVIEHAVFFLEDRQDGLARRRGPATEDGRDVVVDQQFLGLFCESRPIRGAVFLDHLDLAAEHAAHGVDLVDRELFGLDRAGLGNRHRAGGRVQLPNRDFRVGDGKLGRVDLSGRQFLGADTRRRRCQRHTDDALQDLTTVRIRGEIKRKLLHRMCSWG